MKTNRFRNVIAFSILLALFFVIIVALFNYDKSNAYAEPMAYNSVNDTNAEIIDKYKESLIGINAHVDLTEGEYRIVNTSTDDAIVQIVPKEYFYTIGSDIVIENEYGYFVNTEDYGNNNFKSTVLVFKIETQSDLILTYDRIIVTLKPIFEYQYLCVIGTGETLYMDNEQVEYNASNYCVLPYAKLSGSNITYVQSSNFYIKDVSFGGSLFNEQHLNPGDLGYIAADDYGSYFTAFDYEYNGKVRENGNFPLEQIADLNMDCLGLIINGLEGLTAGIPVLGTAFNRLGWVFDIANTGMDVIDVIGGLHSFGNEIITQATKTVTTKCFYQNRKDQLTYYQDSNGNPTLAKVAVVTCNTPTDNSIWYGVGDYARAYFTVGHGDGDGVTPYYTRFIDNIAFKIVDAKEDYVVKVGNGIISTSLRSPEYKSLFFDSKESIYMLPEGQDNFNFKAKYASDYELKISLTDVADITVNGTKYRGRDIHIKQYAPSNGGISISLSGNTAGLNGDITLTPNTSDVVSNISNNEYYILKTNLSGVLQLKTSNPGVAINSIYTIENGDFITYRQYGNINESDIISYPFLNDTYYVVLRNTSSQNIANCSLSVEQVSTLQIESNNSVVLQSENLNYFKINSANNGDYVLSLSNVSGDEYSFQFLNSNLTQLNGTPFRNEFYIIAMDTNKAYYVGIKTGNYENQANVLIKNTGTSFQWKISGGEFGTSGSIISERVQEVKRGNTYTLSFYINGKNSHAALYSENTDTSWGIYGIYFNSNNNQITIPSDCPIGGEGITIKALSLEDINTSYNHTIKLIPTGEIKLNSVSVTNSDDITLRISAPRFVYKIEYNISMLGSQTSNKEITISSTKAGEGPNEMSGSILNDIIVLTVDNKAANATITISKIYYYDALKCERSDSSRTYSTSCHNLYDCGIGTFDLPYEVRCYRHLKNIRHNASSNFILTNDINCSDKWVPIEEFSGTLDLKNHTIKYSKTLATTSERFGFIHNNNGNIKNGTFNISITGVSSDANYYVGGICVSNKGTVENCTVIGKGTLGTYNTYYKDVDVHLSSSFVRYGGIACDNFGTINNCKNKASIGGDISTCGGIVGYFAAGIIYSCSNDTNLYYEQISNGASYFGGLVGEGYYDNNGNIIEIENCTNNGVIEFTLQTEVSPNAIVRIAQIAGVAPENAKITNCKLYGSARISYDNNIVTSSPQVIVTDDAVAEYTYAGGGGSCVAEGTLITLADGKQVPVETLNGNENLLVWNLKTGEFDSAPILFIDSDPEKVYKVINLHFSDGTSVKVISEHAFWDFDLNKYVFLREDANQYMGHWFNKQTTDEGGNLTWKKVQLLNVVIQEEYTVAYSPVTYGHLCYYVNGMLSMPGATEGFINIFDVDGETLKFDEEAKQRDIETYGLFTFEEFTEIYPITEEIFNAFGGQYLKISIGKGLITLDEIGRLINHYAKFLN